MGRAFRKLITSGLAALTIGCAGAEEISAPQIPSTPPSNTNQAPRINSLVVSQVNEKSDYMYQIQATDPDGDRFFCSFSGPSWLVMSEDTCLLHGTAPEVSSDQEFPATVQVTDVRGGSAVQNYNITVKNMNNTWVLSPEQLSGAQVDGSSLTFTQPVDFSAGDFLAAGVTPRTPYGLLRRADSLSSGRTKVYTSPAALENVVSDASVSLHQDLAPSTVRSFSGMRGVSIARSASVDFPFSINLNNVILYDADGNPNTKEDQIIATGELSFAPGFDFGLSIKNSSIDSLYLQQSLNESVNLTIGSNLAGFAPLREVTLAEYAFAPIVLMAPAPIPIPIVLVPKIDVSVGMDASRVNPLSVTVNQEANLTARLRYKGTWSADADFSNTADFSMPSPSGDWDMTAYAGPSLEIGLYGAAGLSVNADANLSLESASGFWQLFGGFNASVGAFVDVLSHRISAYSKQILERRVLLAEKDTTPLPRIAYVTDLSNSRSVIATINPDGTGRQILTSTSELSSNPRWSPDRKEIAISKWISDGRVDIFTLGANPRRLTNGGVNIPGSWSPDGSRIATFSTKDDSDGEIYTNSADGLIMSRITSNSAIDRNPSWSSDNWIYFVSNRGGTMDIYRVRPNRDSLTTVVSGPSIEDNPCVSPDGKYLVYDSDKSGNREIYLMDLSTGVSTNLSRDPSIDYQPRFSRDGANIVFTSTRSGVGSQLYVMGIDGSNPRKITSEKIDNNPDW